MNKPARCAKCGGSPVIEEARVVVQGEGEMDVKLRVDAHPDAKLFKHASRTPLKAFICVNCGYTEFYAKDPASLAEADRAAQLRRAGGLS